MSRNYKFHNPEGLYFISFATVFWVDVFVRRLYFDCVVESLNKMHWMTKEWKFMPGALCRVMFTWFSGLQFKDPKILIRDFKTFNLKEVNIAC